jgi:hypothetical protein
LCQQNERRSRNNIPNSCQLVRLPENFAFILMIFTQRAMAIPLSVPDFRVIAAHNLLGQATGKCLNFKRLAPPKTGRPMQKKLVSEAVA